MNSKRKTTSFQQKVAGLLLTVAGVLPSNTLLADQLNLTITNIPSNDGRLMIQVMAGEAGFKEEIAAAASFILPAKEGSVTLTTDALASGEYGIRILHDEDGDGKMGQNMMGIPNEPWGFSNNATGRFGPPKWDKVKFTLDGTEEQNVKLVH